jgi:hypothetical protein
MKYSRLKRKMHVTHAECCGKNTFKSKQKTAIDVRMDLREMWCRDQTQMDGID